MSAVVSKLAPCFVPEEDVAVEESLAEAEESEVVVEVFETVVEETEVAVEVSVTVVVSPTERGDVPERKFEVVLATTAGEAVVV